MKTMIAMTSTAMPLGFVPRLDAPIPNRLRGRGVSAGGAAGLTTGLIARIEHDSVREALRV